MTAVVTDTASENGVAPAHAYTGLPFPTAVFNVFRGIAGVPGPLSSPVPAATYTPHDGSAAQPVIRGSHTVGLPLLELEVELALDPELDETAVLDVLAVDEALELDVLPAPPPAPPRHVYVRVQSLE